MYVFDKQDEVNLQSFSTTKLTSQFIETLKHNVNHSPQKTDYEEFFEKFNIDFLLENSSLKDNDYLLNIGAFTQNCINRNTSQKVSDNEKVSDKSYPKPINHFESILKEINKENRCNLDKSFKSLENPQVLNNKDENVQNPHHSKDFVQNHKTSNFEQVFQSFSTKSKENPYLERGSGKIVINFDEIKTENIENNIHNILNHEDFQKSSVNNNNNMNFKQESIIKKELTKKVQDISLNCLKKENTEKNGGNEEIYRLVPIIDLDNQTTNYKDIIGISGESIENIMSKYKDYFHTIESNNVFTKENEGNSTQKSSRITAVDICADINVDNDYIDTNTNINDKYKKIDANSYNKGNFNENNADIKRNTNNTNNDIETNTNNTNNDIETNTNNTNNDIEKNTNNTNIYKNITKTSNINTTKECITNTPKINTESDFNTNDSELIASSILFELIDTVGLSSNNISPTHNATQSIASLPNTTININSESLSPSILKSLSPSSSLSLSSFTSSLQPPSSFSSSSSPSNTTNNLNRDCSVNVATNDASITTILTTSSDSITTTATISNFIKIAQNITTTTLNKTKSSILESSATATAFNAQTLNSTTISTVTTTGPIVTTTVSTITTIVSIVDPASLTYTSSKALELTMGYETKTSQPLVIEDTSERPIEGKIKGKTFEREIPSKPCSIDNSAKYQDQLIINSMSSLKKQSPPTHTDKISEQQATQSSPRTLYNTDNQSTLINNLTPIHNELQDKKPPTSLYTTNPSTPLSSVFNSTKLQSLNLPHLNMDFTLGSILKEINIDQCSYSFLRGELALLSTQDYPLSQPIFGLVLCCCCLFVFFIILSNLF